MIYTASFKQELYNISICPIWSLQVFYNKNKLSYFLMLHCLSCMARRPPFSLLTMVSFKAPLITMYGFRINLLKSLVETAIWFLEKHLQTQTLKIITVHILHKHRNLGYTLRSCNFAHDPKIQSPNSCGEVTKYITKFQELYPSYEKVWSF